MSETKHTPGPWYFDKVWGLIMAEGDIEVAAVHTGASMHTKRNDSLVVQANARLIAAAPKMLAQLEKWAEFMQANYSPGDISWWYETMETIAEAKGVKNE